MYYFRYNILINLICDYFNAFLTQNNVIENNFMSFSKKKLKYDL